MLKLYASTLALIIALDSLWIGVVMKSFYVENLSPIGRITGNKFSPVIWAGLLVWVILSLGIIHFALPKIDANSSWGATFGMGAFLGFVIYATYDFTNYSTLRDFPLKVAVIDTLWGMLLCGTVTSLARLIRD